jgi:glutathione reductase (NADPH)
VERLVRATRELGVDLRLNNEVTAIEKHNDHLVVSTSAADERPLEANLVVHGAGRVPEIEDLQLAKAGIERDLRKGIIVNKYLQSVSNPAVYAAGDVAATDGLPLTPVASLEGHVVASNLLNGNDKTADYAGIPSVVFTIPPLASVGMHESAAKAKGLKFTVKQQETSNWFTSRRVAERHSGFKTIVEDSSGRTLGAHVLGPHAEEIINIFALAIRNGISAGELRRMIYAYPTSSSDISYMV